MRIDELTNNSDLDEAPAGMLKQLGRRVGAGLAGAVGMKGTAAKLGGAADAGKEANQLKVKLQRYAGETGINVKQLDAQDLVAFLKREGMPTNSVPASGTVPPKALDDILMKTVQTSKKAGGTAQTPGPTGATSDEPAQGQAQAQAGTAPKQTTPQSSAQAKTNPKVVPMKKPEAGIPPDIQAQLDALTPTEKKVLAGAL